MKSLALVFVLALSSALFPKQASAQQVSVNFQVFYDQLNPYGQWVDYPRYGYVWIPDAGPDFVPYSTRGHWVLTGYGWTWVSDYNWGWAPFHYGRWDYDNYYGWLWIPDNQWGPSWVTWRRANGYFGWSPMGPGISINLSFGSRYNRDNDHWTFVRDRDIERPDINRYYLNRSNHDRIIRNSTIISRTYVDNSRHTTYVSGPAREDVQRITGRTIRPVVIRESTRPGQAMSNGQLQIYRPQVRATNNRDQRPVPSRVTNLKDVKRPAERTAERPATNQPRDIYQSGNNKAQPSQPMRASQPTPSSQPQRAAQPSQSSQYQRATQPVEPVRATQPSQPQRAIQPSQPSQPQRATQPSQPPRASQPVSTQRSVPSTERQQPQQPQPPKASAPVNNNAQPSQPSRTSQPAQTQRANQEQPNRRD